MTFVLRQKKTKTRWTDLHIVKSQTFSQPQPFTKPCIEDAGSSADSTPDLDEVNNIVHPSKVVSEDLSNTQPMYANPLSLRVRFIVLSIYLILIIILNSLYSSKDSLCYRCF